MAAPSLSRDIQNQILDTVSALARSHPGVPAVTKAGNKVSLASLARETLVKKTGVSEHTWRTRIKTVRTQRAGDWALATTGEWHGETREPSVQIAQFGRGVRRYILTAAQNDTPVHGRFWDNLQAYAKHMGAQISVGPFSYQLGVFTDHTARNQVFAEPVRDYIAHQQVDLDPVLWCAEMNILPTAVRPLSGLDTYTRGRYGVFPHAKIQLASVPSIAAGEAAILCTTGACTIPNYIEKKAGLKAQFHHTIGATLVEIDERGEPFMRQLNASDDGSFQDFTLKVSGGKVTDDHRVEGITWGDIHREKIDPVVARICWGIDVETDELIERQDTMIDVLRPRHQFFHDLIDFTYRNHHNRDNPHFLFEMVCGGSERVEDAMRSCSRFLRLSARDFCQSVNAPSNHNDAFPRWLREADGRKDPVNARFWLEANLALYEAIERGETDFDIFRWALARYDSRGLDDIVFLPRDGSYVICQEHGGIENVLHGDKGPNGARGTPLNLSRVSRRINTMHTHTASIIDGVYTGGLCGKFDQGYNEGPSSWSQTQIVTYPSSKRTLVTLRKGRWRAE